MDSDSSYSRIRFVGRRVHNVKFRETPTGVRVTEVVWTSGRCSSTTVIPLSERYDTRALLTWPTTPSVEESPSQKRRRVTFIMTEGDEGMSSVLLLVHIFTCPFGRIFVTWKCVWVPLPTYKQKDSTGDVGVNTFQGRSRIYDVSNIRKRCEFTFDDYFPKKTFSVEDFSFSTRIPPQGIVTFIFRFSYLLSTYSSSGTTSVLNIETLPPSSLDST